MNITEMNITKNEIVHLNKDWQWILSGTVKHCDHWRNASEGRDPKETSFLVSWQYETAMQSGCHEKKKFKVVLQSPWNQN